MDSDVWPDPHAAHTPAEYVTAMRHVRSLTGLTFRQLEKRAERVGDVMPHSTISGALARDTLPKPDLVAAFVRACGGDRDLVKVWLTARARLAVGATPTAQTVPVAETNSAGMVSPAAPAARSAAVPAAVATTPAPSAVPPAGPPGSPASRPIIPRQIDRKQIDATQSATPAPDATQADATAAEPTGQGATGTSPAPVAAAPTPITKASPAVPDSRRRVLALVATGLIMLLLVVGFLLFQRDEAGPDQEPVTAPVTPSSSTGSNPSPSGIGPSSAGPDASATPASGSATTAPGDAQTRNGNGGNPPAAPPKAPGAPANGAYQIRLAHTGLCVGEGVERFKPTERMVLGQHDCATASPPIGLEAQSNSTYRITLDHPRYGPGCVTVDYGGSGSGLLLYGADCGSGRADQQFTLEPMSSPVAGYRLRSRSGSAYCIGVYQASRESGTQLIQGGCTGGSDQIFTLRRL